MTDHINDKYIKVNLSLLVYVVRGLLERVPQAVFGTELGCTFISIINGLLPNKLFIKRFHHHWRYH